MAKLLNLFRSKRARLERDLERELQYHLDRRVDELMRDGASESDARRRARLELGGVPQVQEAVRDTWTWRWLDTFVADVRYATRGLARSWGFTLGAIGVLALGIGASVAIFSVVNTVLLRPLPYPNADRIMSVETFWTNTGQPSPEVSAPDFRDWRAQNDVFETMAHFVGEEDVAIVVGDRAEFANDMFVSADFFTVFGQPASAGRLLTERDVPSDDDAVPTVVIVRHGWAEAHFGTAEAAIGQSISVYGMPMQIVGVAARGFSHPGATDLWMPWGTNGTNRSAAELHVVGRLKPGVELGQAQAEMRRIGDNLGQQYPENRLKTVAVVPLQERLTGDVQTMLWVLMGAVLVVLLIACANISNLLLARAAVRTREIALRAALGAGRGRLARQLLTESFVLGALAGVVGVLLAFLFVRGVVALSPADLPRLDEVAIDTTALLFALALSAAATLLFGLVPAIHTSRLNLSHMLKQGGSKGASSGGGSRSRSVLVIAEVALSVILLATAGLLLRSFEVLQRVELGFTTERVMVAYTQYPANTVEDRQARTRFYADLVEQLRTVPGVTAAAGINLLPMGREPRPAGAFFVQGRPEGQPGDRPRADMNAITPGYFGALDIPLRAGRDFDRFDTEDRPPVAIVNETLARTAFPGESALGQRIRRSSNGPWMEIVGVVADTRWQGPSTPPAPVIFAASAQGIGGSLSILARSSLDEQALASTVRTLVSDAAPGVPVRIETMDDLFVEAMAYPQFRTRLIGAFAAVAALLSAIGIFSVLAYLVGQRTREIAVRRAVGAGRSHVVGLVVGQTLRLVAVGLVVGLAGALAGAQLLQGLLFEISPWDVGPYFGALAIIGIAAALATVVPAMRAAVVTPLLALRAE